MRHGGDVYRIGADLGLAPERVLDFSASINPLGMPAAARRAIEKGIGMLGHYPDPASVSLARAVGQAYGVSPDRVLAGNGSTELIYLVVRALRPRSVLVTEPAFSDYGRAARLAGARVRGLRLRKENGFRVEPGEFTAAMQGVEMAFLCNPNNPTGHGLEREVVLEIAAAAEKTGCLLVLDEAFADFCPACSVLPGDGHPALLVLRSLTKFYALPGLRIGFGWFPPPLLAKIREHKEPWTVNVLAEMAGSAALLDREYRAATLAFMARERAWLREELEGLGFKVYPSVANYLLLEAEDAPDLFAGLLSRGIAVRDCTSFPGLGPQFLRIAVRSRPDNERLLAELRRIRSQAGH